MENALEYQDQQKIIDEEHLKLLRIGYFILAGTNLFALFIGVIYLAFAMIMGTILSAVGSAEDAEFAALFPIIMGVVGLLIVVVVGGIGTLQLLAARNLKIRKGRTLCLWAAGVSCLSLPWGTLVGVSTFSVLGRSTVRAVFDGQPPIHYDSDIPRPPGMYM